MATYFHGNSEIQAAAADGMQLQTLYLMNPNYVPYSDTATLPNNSTLLLNTAGDALNPSNISHAPPSNAHHHLLVGTPLPAPFSNLAQTSSEDINRSSLHGIFPPAAAVQYDLWGSIDQNSDQDHSQVVTLAAHTDGSPLGLRRPVASMCRQGLSLSLSSKQAGYSSSSNNNNRAMDIEVEGQARGQVAATSPVALTRLSENSPSSVSAVSNGIPNVQSVLWGSKYLRTAQELLDEVVNVGNMITDSTESKGKMKLNKETMATAGEGSNTGESSSTSKLAAELTTAQRQELQIKKAKLVSMLDEVEQRYRQYHHQMQLVISSFEQAAGFGSAKSYTALALRTISKQFRCLKDAICGEIKATSKKLGEEECLGAKIEGSRLRFVDNQLRQQRALQQLGMMQHNAWRPQRGLPERAVSILRAWLFEHFLHPYPKDSDKHILAKQTGLTRSQVSNWFINARVRLWKPMVEEMYLEEMKEQERNGSEDNVNKIEHKESGSNSTFQESISFKLEQEKAFQYKAEKSTNHNASPTKLANSAISMSSMGGNLQAQTEFNLIGSSFLEGVVQRSPKKPRSTIDMQNSPSSILSIDMDHMKQGETSRELTGQFGSERLTKDGYNLVTSTTNHGGGGFGAYTMGDIGRFNSDHLAPRFHGNGVSLTLGLPHGENLSISGPQQNLLSGQNIQLGRGLVLGSGEPGFCGIDSPQPSHSSTGYEQTIDIQSRKRFAAQLLPDFVT